MPLPAASLDALQHHAGRYFDYAEEFCRRGAPELAAPFYRQAYVLLQAASQPGAAGPSSRPQAQPIPAQPSTPISMPAEPAESSSAEASAKPDAGESFATALAALRRRLSRETAAAVRGELQQLRQQGCRAAELAKLEGVAALLLEDRGTAERHFREALALDPRHYGALVNLGGLLLAEGRGEQAIPLLQQALEQVAPDSPEALPALTNLSLAHQRAGQAMEAALLVQRVQRLRPGHLRPERLLEAAQTLQEMGEDPAAIELLDWLAQHQPSPPALRLLAALLERRGDYRQAALVYRRLHPEPFPEPQIADSAAPQLSGGPSASPLSDSPQTGRPPASASIQTSISPSDLQ